MTLKEWSIKNLPFFIHGERIGIMDNKIPNRSDLRNLDDYHVESVQAGVIWLRAETKPKNIDGRKCHVCGKWLGTDGRCYHSHNF